MTNVETTEGGGGARLEALHALEGTRTRVGEAESTHSGENIRAGGSGEEKPIIMCGDRLYSDWAGDWGRFRSGPFSPATQLLNSSIDDAPRKIPGAGALFPEGYFPRVGSPEPWICPVRDCQTIFSEAWALGGHFSVSASCSISLAP